MNDTICAVSTALIESAIGIIRISGDKSKEILRSVFLFKNPPVKIQHRKFYYGRVVDIETTNVIDEALVVFMAAPFTYTGEDTAEIHAHGGTASMGLILKEVLKAGARIAQPGEFTKRAFLNGKIDLMQAEAVLDIIQAKTKESLALAHKQKQGGFSEKILCIKEKMLDWLMLLEAHIDFCEEDLPELNLEEFSDEVSNWKKQIESLILQLGRHRIYREGLNIIILGRPNAGKSSVFNNLLEDERAIVADMPGTTRDSLEAWTNFNGIPVRLMDTAGIINSCDVVESMGVKRTLKCLESSDIVILVIDASRDIYNEDHEVFRVLENKLCLVLLNKSDLGKSITEENFKNYFEKYEKAIYTSMVTGAGLDEIKEEICSLVHRKTGIINQKFNGNARHESILREALFFLDNIRKSIAEKMPVDLFTIDIAGTVKSLEKITGEAASEDIINEIFSRFCVGK